MNWLVRPSWVNPDWSWWRWIRFAFSYQFITPWKTRNYDRFPPWSKCAPHWQIIKSRARRVDGVHISEIAEWNPNTIRMINTKDLGITRRDYSDGSWAYFDKDGKQVGCGFSTSGFMGEGKS